MSFSCLYFREICYLHAYGSIIFGFSPGPYCDRHMKIYWNKYIWWITKRLWIALITCQLLS